MARTVVLLVTLAFLGLLAFLTIDVITRDGVTPLVLVSLLLLAVIGFGVVGALVHPPEE